MQFVYASERYETGKYKSNSQKHHLKQQTQIKMTDRYFLQKRVKYRLAVIINVRCVQTIYTCTVVHFSKLYSRMEFQ